VGARPDTEAGPGGIREPVSQGVPGPLPEVEVPGVRRERALGKVLCGHGWGQEQEGGEGKQGRTSKAHGGVPSGKMPQSGRVGVTSPAEGDGERQGRMHRTT
jgi:hypothetical protein